jgi:hypothetical protein
MCRADTRAATTTEDSRPNLADEASEEEFMSTGQPAASRRLVPGRTECVRQV